MSGISDEVRKSFKEHDDKRDAGLKTPADIIRYDEIVYGEDSTWQVLDVYRPRVMEGKLPVIVSVHGGAWMYGDKERYQFYCMELAKSGFAVVNFTYRLAPEFKFPAPLEDTKLVFNWIHSNADKYSFDTSNVFAVGDSAGANILCLYIFMLTSYEYRRVMKSRYGLEISGNVYTYPQLNNQHSSYSYYNVKGNTSMSAVYSDEPKYSGNYSMPVIIKAVALNCGVYRMEVKELENYILEYMPEGGNEEELKLLDIPTYVNEEFPATYLMTGTDDFLKNQPAILVKEFTDKMVPFVYRMYGDSKNKLTHIFHCDIKSKDAKICNEDECNFFKSFI